MFGKGPPWRGFGLRRKLILFQRLSRFLAREHLVLAAFPLSLAHMCSLLLAAEEGPPVCWQRLAKMLVHLGLCIIFEELMDSVLRNSLIWGMIEKSESPHIYTQPA